MSVLLVFGFVWLSVRVLVCMLQCFYCVHKDKALYGSSPPCMVGMILCVLVCLL